ncbi:MAG: hypothetical protein ACU0AT_10135 [Tranquillimonas sp.]
MRRLRAPAWSAPGVIRAILAAQIALGALLVAADLDWTLPRPAAGRDAPPLDQPVRPGDQTRRYRPDTATGPQTGPLRLDHAMPDRLDIAASSLGNRRILRLTGAIAPGDALRFAEMLDAASPAPSTVFLDSPGGYVADVLEIGRRIRAAGLETQMAADDICLSACPFILAGGVRRHIEDGAQVGVHQQYFGESTLLPAFLAVADIQRGQAEVMAYLEEMGVDLRLMRPALLTPPDSIYILLREELEDYRLVTPGSG